MIIFDELVGCYSNDIIDRQLVIEFLSNKDNLPEIVLTGRNPLDELSALADYLSEVKKIKHPYERGVKARHGIEF